MIIIGMGWKRSILCIPTDKNQTDLTSAETLQLSSGDVTMARPY